ncbi:hypothetical protein AVEN_258663-1 [Araneus ventricosus]|uniref:Uncharacterized protein n=1 Tax=Araneus ventricosus TaxID=182803 RepID=A0A4Y2UP05_ARAVE|nr:hypothetical protein AVEN_258663-1 [Araneus ventricosus]
MKDAATVKNEKSKQEVEKSKIRRWILNRYRNDTQTAVTLYAMKKFLDSKQSGLSNNPETKLVIKRHESGHLVKIEGFLMAKMPKGQAASSSESKSGNESKNLAKGSATLAKRSPTKKVNHRRW